MKVSPAALPYLRRFGVMPAHVKPTGPRGYLSKGDVLAYVKKQNLSQIVLKRPDSDFIDISELKKEQLQVKAEPAPVKAEAAS